MLLMTGSSRAVCGRGAGRKPVHSGTEEAVQLVGARRASHQRRNRAEAHTGAGAAVAQRSLERQESYGRRHATGEYTVCGGQSFTVRLEPAGQLFVHFFPWPPTAALLSCDIKRAESSATSPRDADRTTMPITTARAARK